MPKVIFGNHSSVLVPRQDRDRIRGFYCDVLGGKITKVDPERDFIRLGDDFYVALLYGDVPDESEFLRSARSVWLEIKTDDVEGMRRRILDFGVRKLEVPDAHLYFQAPGGQCLRLVGIDEDLSFYEGAGDGPSVAKIKEATKTAHSISLKTREIWHEILIHASADEIYQALTNVRKLAHWWTTDVRGETAIGQTLEFWFSGFRAAAMEVTALRSGELVRWRVVDGDATDWLGTELEFLIVQDGDQPLLHFRHSDWKEGAKSFPHCSMGWAIFLISLKEFIETGKGRPHPYDMPINLWRPPQT